MRTNFDSYQKLKCSDVMWGSKKKLKINEAENILFEKCELISIVEAIWNEIVHNGTWKWRTKIFICYKEGIHYCGFVYNSLYIFDELFSELYITEENWEYVDNSNSYVVAGESFWIDTGYDDEEEFEEGVFINENNKISRWAKIEDAKMRIHEFQKSKLYYIKLDIESFFQNLYTHYFARIANFEPYKSMDVTSDYFDFLDRFHQRINDNQTKGVPAGNFSSHIGAELLMLCVDYEIREIIDKTDMKKYGSTFLIHINGSRRRRIGKPGLCFQNGGCQSSR